MHSGTMRIIDRARSLAFVLAEMPSLRISHYCLSPLAGIPRGDDSIKNKDNKEWSATRRCGQDNQIESYPDCRTDLYSFTN